MWPHPPPCLLSSSLDPPNTSLCQLHIFFLLLLPNPPTATSAAYMWKGVNNVPVATLPKKKKRFSLPQQPLTTNVSSIGSEPSRVPPLSVLEFWLAWSCVGLWVHHLTVFTILFVCVCVGGGVLEDGCVVLPCACPIIVSNLTSLKSREEAR